MNVPVRSFPEPAISLRHPAHDSNSNMDATVRRAVVEPEPRQTTPSIVKLSSLERPRRRWVSMLSAAAILIGVASVASAFANADGAAITR